MRPLVLECTNNNLTNVQQCTYLYYTVRYWTVQCMAHYKDLTWQYVPGEDSWPPGYRCESHHPLSSSSPAANWNKKILLSHETRNTLSGTEFLSYNTGKKQQKEETYVPDVRYLNLKLVGLLRLLQRCVHVLRLKDGLLTQWPYQGVNKEMSSIFSNQ